MKIDLADQINEILLDSIKKIIRQDNFQIKDIPQIILLIPKNKSHGDLSVNIAMQLSRELNLKPLDIIVETFDDREYAKNRLIGPTNLAVSFAKEIKTDFNNFGLLLDLSHIPILEEDFVESLKIAKDFIKHIHIGNCILKDKDHPAFGDNHPRFGIVNGENDMAVLTDFIKALIEIDYFKKAGATLIFEVKPLPGEDPELTIAGSKRFLSRVLNNIY